MPALVPVNNFDLSRYLGKWYEIARLPAWFERGMDSVTAEYSLREDGSVKVVNEGFRKGKLSRAEGRAKPGGRRDEGYLRVSFFRPFYADYRVIDLDSANYQWALVASGRSYLWILSRTAMLEPQVMERLIGRAKELGFRTERLYYTKQSGRGV